MPQDQKLPRGLHQRSLIRGDLPPTQPGAQEASLYGSLFCTAEHWRSNAPRPQDRRAPHQGWPYITAVAKTSSRKPYIGQSQHKQEDARSSSETVASIESCGGNTLSGFADDIQHQSSVSPQAGSGFLKEVVLTLNVRAEQVTEFHWSLVLFWCEMNPLTLKTKQLLNNRLNGNRSWLVKVCLKSC